MPLSLFVIMILGLLVAVAAEWDVTRCRQRQTDKLPEDIQ